MVGHCISLPTPCPSCLDANVFFYPQSILNLWCVCVCVCVCVGVSKRDSLVMCSSEKVNEKVSFCIPLLYRSSQKSFQNNALHPNSSRGIFISPDIILVSWTIFQD